MVDDLSNCKYFNAGLGFREGQVGTDVRWGGYECNVFDLGPLLSEAMRVSPPSENLCHFSNTPHRSVPHHPGAPKAALLHGMSAT
jgi:hypothetical protein